MKPFVNQSDKIYRPKKISAEKCSSEKFPTKTKLGRNIFGRTKIRSDGSTEGLLQERLLKADDGLKKFSDELEAYKKELTKSASEKISIKDSNDNSSVVSFIHSRSPKINEN